MLLAKDTGPVVRLVLAISLDGRLAPSLKDAAWLGASGDRRALEEALAWADGTLMGVGTLHAYGSTCLIHDADLLARRAAEGRSPQPVCVVVGGRQVFQTHWSFFQQPIERWLLGTTDVSGFVTQLKPAESWYLTLRQLKVLGLRHLVLLGGARLIGSLLSEDTIDELQLTLTPHLLGGEACWLPTSLAKLPAKLRSKGAWQLQRADKLGGDELLLIYSRYRLPGPDVCESSKLQSSRS